MGQCTSSIDLVQDDEIAVATRPVSGAMLLCHSFDGGNKNEAKKTFLKLHHHDRLRKCILDPTEVNHALRAQADEMMKGKDTTSDIREHYGLDRAYAGVGSKARETTFMPTAVTNPAPMSHRAAQSEHYEMVSRQHSLVSTSTIQEDSSRVGSSTGMQDQTYEQFPPYQQGDDNLSMDAEYYLRSQQMVFDKYKNLFMGLVQPSRLQSESSAREAYMSVLHLEMQASLGTYFCKRYFPMFPRSPVPRGFRRQRTTTVPQLVSSDSDSSASQSSDARIGFGNVPPCKPITSSITGEVFMDLAITGSLGLVPKGHSQKSPLDSDLKSPDDYIVLMNRRSGAPLAVCTTIASNGLPIVRIYASKPRVLGQLPSTTTKKFGMWTDTLPLYAWAEVVTESIYPQPERFAMYMASGSGSEGRFSLHPSYVATSSVENGSPLIKVLGRTDREARYSGCALISLRASKDEEDVLSFEIDVAYGIDPALFICLTAIMDEIIEKSMRRRYKAKKERKKAGPRRNAPHVT